jgi:hypothetical protein
MLFRISLIVAILAGLGAGGLAYYEFSNQIPQLKQQRDSEKDAKVTEIAAHNKTKAELKKTQGELVQTQQELADTKSERDKAVARADAQAKRADDLNDRLTKANADLQDAQNQLASYKASDLTPDEVVQLNKKYKAAETEIAVINEEKAIIQRQYASIKAKYEKLVGLSTDILLRPDLKGKILVVDPKWDFVVLDIGGDQGAVQDGELLVSRDGKLVAKVVIRSVQKDRSIANIVPGWKLGEVIEGDVVTPAHPASS